MGGICAHPGVGMARQFGQSRHECHQGVMAVRAGQFLEHHAGPEPHVQAGFGVGDDGQQGGQAGRHLPHQVQHLAGAAGLEQIVQGVGQAPVQIPGPGGPGFQFPQGQGAGQLKRAQTQPGHAAHLPLAGQLRRRLDIHRLQATDDAALEQFGEPRQQGRAMGTISGQQKQG